MIPRPSPFWRFVDDDGTFRAEEPQKVSRLYFPLGNEAGLLSAVTPDLHGDIKAGQNAFLTPPVSEQDLHASRVRRDFWLRTPKGAWLANAGPADRTTVEAGPLWHVLRRENRRLGLACEVLSFVPAAPDRVEVMRVSVRNTGKSPVAVTPTAAVPLYARSADNVRDHRHVTSLLHRIHPHENGVLVRPTMTFDERGHAANEITYAALGFEAGGTAPAGSFPTVESFIGEGGDFDRPAAVLENRAPQPWKTIAGKEAMGAIRFKTRTLKPGQSAAWVLVLGVALPGDPSASAWARAYGSVPKADKALAATKAHWKKRLDALRFGTGDPLFNRWARWVTLQPMLRKIFGCSFLPDFDYGRGGRGWRDLWQDCLALLLLDPSEARPLLLNNFGGVRLDGTNATIIGHAPGEFVADRNSITRVWMDHGLWPAITTELYVHQSGDSSILWEEAPYFRDPQLRRAQARDTAWTEAHGRRWRTKEGAEHKGTVLEHMLVQHLCSFYNAGEHNMVRLEDADWNDGLDMAHGRGESVAFSALYAGNLAALAGLLEEAAGREGRTDVAVAEELTILLDQVGGEKADYDSAEEKKRRLETYFEAVSPVTSGRKTRIPVRALAEDLRAKSRWLSAKIRDQEWLRNKNGLSWFNGYYDGKGRRVEGDHPRGPRMTLTGQVFPVMAGVATEDQCRDVWKSAKRLLQDKARGGFRLNTDFKELQPDLGRAFSFSYGDKENGAVFSHMDVMFANALYRRGMAAEGREVLMSLFKMAVDTDGSRIYPGLPEYFNAEGRGLYHYLTGSASWYVLTLLTVVFGVRGRWGDLLLDPRLMPEDFSKSGEASVHTSFAGRPLTVAYRNPRRLPFGRYRVAAVAADGRPVDFEALSDGSARVLRAVFASPPAGRDLRLDILLERR